VISIIIPTYNEAQTIHSLVTYLKEKADSDLITEIIVTDGGSTDQTVALASHAGATALVTQRKGRGPQMNKGANVAKGDILYFLHADSYPPAGFNTDIVQAVAQGYQSGCYRLQFDHSHWFLRLNCWFTRFNVNSVRFGDQSLFITKDLFHKIGCFREDLVVMEDQEIIYRIRKHTRFRIFSRSVTTSARKYLDNGIVRLQGIFFVIWLLYQFGVSQQKLVKVYRWLIHQDKV
jgi:rSAM/selenodomain-associated transferase 2